MHDCGLTPSLHNIIQRVIVSNWLSQNSWIIGNKHFVSFNAKILEGQKSMLSPQKKRSVSHLETEIGGAYISCNGHLEQTHNFALEVLKRSFTVNCLKEKSKYENWRFIVPTSNVCERLFSTADHAIGDRRKPKLHLCFDCQTVLECWLEKLACQNGW